MTKSEFLQELETQLKNYDIPDYEEILKIYSNRFNIYYEINFTDDEIVKELGNPEEIAKSYIPKKNEENKEDIIIDIIPPKDEKEGQNDINEKSKKEYNLDISLQNVKSLHIIHRLNDGFSFYCNEDGYKKDFNFSISNNTVKLRNKFGTSLFKTPKYNATLEIGKDIKLTSLNINCLTGQINIDSILADDMFIRSVSADCNFNNLFAKTLKIELLSGNHKANSIIAKESMNISSVSGNLNIDDIETKVLDLSTVSGDINITNITCDEANLSTISGDIKIGTAKIKNNNITSSHISGDIIINKYL